MTKAAPKAGEQVETDLAALAALLWALGETPADAGAQDRLLNEISRLLWGASEPDRAAER